MKQILLSGMLCLVMAGLNATTYFLKAGATGNGTSWADASGDLVAVLVITKAGDIVWLAKGIYYPTNDMDRKKSFVIPAGVKIYGGFAGNETALQERNVLLNRTVLSGNIGSKKIFTDNSYTVVSLINVNDDTLLDGFIITDGSAGGTGPAGDPDKCGGGLYIDGAGKGNVCSPVIQNCIFQNNTARDGGAVYINGREGACYPVFNNCQFFSNKADLDGGAIFHDGRHNGNTSPVYFECTFKANEGNYGGAVCNYGGKGESSPQFQNCRFENNQAHLRGGAIFNMDVEGRAVPAINNCQFVANKAVKGQGMYTFSKPETKFEGTATIYKMN